MAAPLAAQSSSSAHSQDADTMLDVSLLKELAKKALVDALNSVRGPALTLRLTAQSVPAAPGQWREDTRAGPVNSRTAWPRR